MKVLIKFFKNNGHLRGFIYVFGAVLIIAADRFEAWSKVPPANGYVIAAFFCFILANALNSLRAYLDQHLSRNPDPASENAKPEKVGSVLATEKQHTTVGIATIPNTSK